MLSRRAALGARRLGGAAVRRMLRGTPAANPSCALCSNATRRRAFRWGARGGFCERRSSGETACRTNAEHFFPSRPGICHVAFESAVDDQLGHLFDDVAEIKFGDTVALKVGSRIQEIDGIGHAVLYRELDRIHFVAKRLIDRLRIFHDARAELCGKISVIDQVAAFLWI